MVNINTWQNNTPASTSDFILFLILRNFHDDFQFGYLNLIFKPCKNYKSCLKPNRFIYKKTELDFD